METRGAKFVLWVDKWCWWWYLHWRWSWWWWYESIITLLGPSWDPEYKCRLADLCYRTMYQELQIVIHCNALCQYHQLKCCLAQLCHRTCTCSCNCVPDAVWHDLAGTFNCVTVYSSILVYHQMPLGTNLPLLTVPVHQRDQASDFWFSWWRFPWRWRWW